MTWWPFLEGFTVRVWGRWGIKTARLLVAGDGGWVSNEVGLATAQNYESSTGRGPLVMSWVISWDT